MQTQTTKTVRRSRSALEARNALISVLSGAECYQSTSSEVTDRVMALRKRFNLPSYEWSFLNGYEACRRDSWHRYKLVHCYIGADGKPFVGNWTTMTEEQREWCRQSKNTIGGFWWVNKDGTLGRPYFVSGESIRDEQGHWNVNEVTEPVLKAS